ncbi:MAG: 6-bladed beta-propeller, partial [Tannerella sp.]|nr:6-bladed beta-propeller [Tannerella sp.]
MNHIIEIIIFLLIAVSCSSGGKKKNIRSERENVSKTNVATSGGTLPVIKIRRPSGKLPALKLSEIADDIRYIKLETHNDALVGYCQVFRSDKSSCMFIYYGRQLYKFDATGKYIKRIGQPGQGPSDFTPRHVAVDFERETIYVFPGSPSTSGNYVLKLDFDGNIIEKTGNELVFYPNRMALLGGELIFLNDPLVMDTIWNKSLHMQLYLFNPDSNRISSYLPNFRFEDRKNIKFTGGLYHMGKITLAVGNDVAYYKFILNDTVYRIYNKEIKPFLIMDIEKNLSLEDYLGKTGSETLNRKLLIDDVRAFKNHLMFGVVFVKDSHNEEYETFLCLYDLVTGKLSYHDHMVLNDLDGGPNFGALTSVFELPLLKNPDEQFRKFFLSGHDGLKVKFPEKKNELKKLIDMSDEEDNPIIQ